jgi:molybdate transport system ATP-binding protein
MQAAVGDAVISLGDAGEGQVFVLVHPRSVALYRARPDGSPRNCWQAVVISLEGLGDRVRVEVEGPLKVVAEVTLGSVVALGLRPGEHVWASFKASEVEVYPV